MLSSIEGDTEKAIFHHREISECVTSCYDKEF